ncbi:MAG: DUF4384 domain-containing protein [Pyrinomonadaceae bacterium]
MRSALKSKWLFPAALAATLLCAAHAPAQEPAAAAEDDYDGSKQIKYSFSNRPSAPNKKKTQPPPPAVYERVETRKARANTGAWNTGARPQPAATTQPAPATNKSKPQRHNAGTRDNHPPAPPRPPRLVVEGFVDIGVTLWRLRTDKLEEAEAGVSFLTADGLKQLVTPVRMSNTEVQLGDRLRFSIESPRTGYLYVINSTQYTDNSVEEPELIFPTALAGGENNHVKPGLLVFIPALDAKPSYFRVTAEGPAGKVNAGEIVNIIYSARPIPELSTLSLDKVRISRAMVEKWSSTWGDMARQQQLNLVGGEGRPATIAEHEAAESDGSKALTQDAPKPQMLFRVRANPNGPAMVTLHLTYGDSAASQK